MDNKIKIIVCGIIFLIQNIACDELKGQNQTDDQVQEVDTKATPYSELLTKNRKTIFFMMQRAWQANKPMSYFGLYPKHIAIGDRNVDLKEGEGKSGNGSSLFEAKFSLEYPLFMGKLAYGSPFQKMNQITFDYETIFRMTLDRSFPLTTPNQDVGFSWKVNLFNSHSGSVFKLDNKTSNPKYDVSNADNSSISFYNLKLSLHHYSNGQSGSSFYEDETTGKQRNNYIDGNFSTNYIAIGITRGVYKMPSKELHQLSLFYRLDGGIGSTLSFDPNQENSYGKNRLRLMYDYRSGMDKNKAHKNYYWHLRSELEYIAGNLDDFKANIVNNDNKYRLSGSFTAEVSPLRQRHLGFFLKTYYGRDYLNIRYDDIIFSSMVGITLDLNKYFVPKIY